MFSETTMRISLGVKKFSRLKVCNKQMNTVDFNLLYFDKWVACGRGLCVTELEKLKKLILCFLSERPIETIEETEWKWNPQTSNFMCKIDSKQYKKHFMR